MRFVSPPPLHALKLSFVEIVFQDRTILWMRTLCDDHLSPLLWTQPSDIRKALFRNDHIKVVFRLIDVCAHGDDTTHPVRIRFRWPRGRCVHNTVLRRSKEISRATDTIQHAGSHHASAVCVGVDVDFYGSVHSNNA